MIPAQQARSLDSRLSLAEKIFTGGFILALLALPLVVLFTLQAANDHQMRKHTEEISLAISNLRRYYATNVVQRLQESQGKAVFTERYREVHGGIPIPATFSIEMGELFGRTHKDTAVKYAFVSDYPFASRPRPQVDDFQASAIQAFRNDPKLQVFELNDIPLIGAGLHRYATPVVMQQACVACHNSHPDSPKRDWMTGDIRGIQEVSVGGVESSLHDFRYLFYYFALITVLAFGSVLVFRRTAGRLAASNAELELSWARQADVAGQLKEKVGELSLLAAVADRSTFGITIADARRSDLPLIYANESFYRLTGLTPGEVIGKNCRFLKGPQTNVEATAGLREAIENGRPHTVELINYRRNGTTFWNRLTLFPVGGQPGHPDYFVGYQIDVTPLREAEAERSVMLNEIQEGRKLESLGVLVAGIAHEINNPLGIALTATTYVSQSAASVRSALVKKGMLAPEVQEFLEDESEAFGLIEANLKRAAALVRSFKDVAADRAQDARRSVDLGQYLETLASTFVPLMRQSRCRLTIDAPTGIEVSIDTGAFGQLVTNLVVNATVHAFAGIDSPEILIRAERVDDAIRVAIEDNGVGIPPEVLAKLFTPFFTTRRGTGGTGLGLFISRRIAADSLRGDLSVEQVTPQGTRMVLTFPA